MPVFGLVAAGPYDLGVLDVFLRKVRPDLSEIESRQAGNDSRVATTLRQKLKELAVSRAGKSVDKVIVARDSHRDGEERAFAKLRAAFQPQDYPFPVELVVIVPELESWLLCDHEALGTLTGNLGRETTYEPVGRSPEVLPDPKKELTRRLGQAGISYTERVARRLAELSRLQYVEQLCQSFTHFKNAALHC